MTRTNDLTRFAVRKNKSRFAGGYTDRESLWHAMLPYVLRRVSDDEWLLLNRNYKPLGIQHSAPYIDYTNDNSTIIFRRKPSDKQLLAIAHGEATRTGGVHRDEHGAITSVFLYYDGNGPARKPAEYYKRLARLMTLDIIPAEYTEAVGDHV